MQIHAALGNRDGVNRQYRLCADVLAQEMGIEPAAETQTLFHQLLASEPGSTVSPERPPIPQPGEQPPVLPFWGRERELAVLQARLDQAKGGGHDG